MGAELGLLQPWWLLALPLPLVWLAWRRRRPRPWPTLLPPMTLRYPLLSIVTGEGGRGDHATSATRLLRATRRLLARRRFRQQVAQAHDAHALRRLLITSTGSPTVTDWAATQRHPVATEVAASINKVCFSAATPVDIATLKHTLRCARLL